MTDINLEDLSDDVFKRDLLRAVVSENIDAIPDEFSDQERFILGSIRAAAGRVDVSAMCAFFYSEASSPETAPFGFSRIAHMQDRHGRIGGCIIATNQDANNGMSRLCQSCTPAEIMNEIEGLGFGERCAVIWDPNVRAATIYPAGVSASDTHVRKTIASHDADLSQDDVCAALDQTYNENLKNPSAHTIKLWSKNELIERAEDEIERHIKGQLTMFFVGSQRLIKILSQTNTTAGRTDLIFLQKSPQGGPCMMGVLELKVLRGSEERNKRDTEEGLAQGYFYRFELWLPFATLALLMSLSPLRDDVKSLLEGQKSEHIAEVRVRRYPIYDTPKAWRDAGGPEMP